MATRRAQRWSGLVRGVALAVVFFSLIESSAEANGIFRNGVGARAMSLGGADVAWVDDALGAMAANPAGLGFLRSPTLDLGLTGVLATGEFTNPANDDGRLTTTPSLVPDGAFALPLGSVPVTLGVALVPESLLVADWRYVDTPGGLGGTTYGRQQHKSEILVLRSAVGLGFALGPNLSLGGSVGLMYNANKLEAPYIFQTQPTLRGFKTLLDLDTTGYGWNGSVGILFRPHEDLQLGLTYTSETTIRGRGDATGDASAQLATLGAPFRPDFRYDAEVETTFPQMATAGLSWKVHPRWRLAVQIDWINWRHAFDQLPIRLTNGDNADINSLVGSNSLNDTVPLRWHDRFVFRVGLEHAVSENVWLRAGYAYGKSPVPESTLTPLTAVIMEHTVTAGLGFRHGRYRVDLAYQADVPTARRVRVSGLEAGEYSDSRTEVTIHWVAATVSIQF